MASALLTKTLLGHRLFQSSIYLPHKPQIFSSFVNKRPVHLWAEPTYLAYITSGLAPCCMASSIVGTRADFSTQSVSSNKPVVSVDWLYSNLSEPDMKVLGASWYMADEKRNPLQECQIELQMMFRVFGHDRVCVLDGGLPRWRASGFDVESSAFGASGDAILKASAVSEAIEKVYQGQAVGPITFQTKFQPHLVWMFEQVKKNIENKTHQHIDARSKVLLTDGCINWFDEVVPEPRKGIRSGHVPGSRCIPFAQMLDGSQTLLPADELKKRFDQEGISLDGPVVTWCGTGVTACILALGLHRLGKPDVTVYDGSWTEWGAQSESDAPVATS